MTYEPSISPPTSAPAPLPLTQSAPALREDRDLLSALLTLRGVAGVALGVFEFAMPRKIAAMDGLDGKPDALVRLSGAHKIVTGLGLLAGKDERPWLLAALAGSAFDGAALASRHANGAAYRRLAALAGVDAALIGAADLRILEEIAF